MTNIEQLENITFELADGEEVHLFKDESGKSIIDSQETMPTWSALQNLRHRAKNLNGAKNIGIAVNEMTHGIVMSNVQPKIETHTLLASELENGKTTTQMAGKYQRAIIPDNWMNKSAIRLFDVLSSFISIATDEAKEQLNAYYGYTQSAIVCLGIVCPVFCLS